MKTCTAQNATIATRHIQKMKYHLSGRKVNHTKWSKERVWSLPVHLSTAYLVFQAEHAAKPSVTFSNNSPSVFVRVVTSVSKCGRKSVESADYVGSIVENDWRGCLGVFTSRKGSLGPPVGTKRTLVYWQWRDSLEGFDWNSVKTQRWKEPSIKVSWLIRRCHRFLSMKTRLTNSQ